MHVRNFLQPSQYSLHCRILKSLFTYCEGELREFLEKIDNFNDLIFCLVWFGLSNNLDYLCSICHGFGLVWMDFLKIILIVSFFYDLVRIVSIWYSWFDLVYRKVRFNLVRYDLV